MSAHAQCTRTRTPPASQTAVADAVWREEDGRARTGAGEGGMDEAQARVWRMWRCWGTTQ